MAKAQQSANGRATARPGGPGAGAAKAGRGGRAPAPPAGRGNPAAARGGPAARGAAGNSGKRNSVPAARAGGPVRNGDTAPVPRAKFAAAAPGEPPAVPPAPTWLIAATGVLVLIGLGLSVYLTITHLNPKTLFCSSHGLVNCEAVTQSTQSKIFGIFPVAELGLGFFVFMTAICSPWAWRMKGALRLGRLSIGNQELRWIRLAAVTVGIGFVLYLLFVELIQLGSICLYCTGVHIATFLLFVLILFDFVFRQAPAYQAAPVSAKRTKG
jgi:uncharacterized membrane protein